MYYDEVKKTEFLLILFQASCVMSEKIFRLSVVEFSYL